MTYGAETNADGRASLHDELRRLRRQLADAWWYERPLAEIEQIEARIAALTETLERRTAQFRTDETDTTTAGTDAPAQPRCRPGEQADPSRNSTRLGTPTARSACIPTF